GGAGFINVISDLDGHRKVVQMYDADVNEVRMYQSISPSSINTIEFWVRSTDTSKTIYLYLYEGGIGGTIIIGAFIYVDRFGWNDGGGNIYVLDPALDNTWYHWRWDINQSSNTFDWYIDGVLVSNNGSFLNPITTGIDTLSFKSNLATYSDYSLYVDAIGYSWDSDYNVEDNLNAYGREVMDEGDVGWGTDIIPYSIGIRGEYANHKKYLELYDDSDTDFYRATNSFEDDLVGGNPTGWSVNEAGGTIDVIASEAGHRKVVELDDTNGGAKLLFQKSNIVAGSSTGFMELWYRKDSNNEYSSVRIGETSLFPGSITVYFKIDGRIWYQATNIRAYVANTWYHLKWIWTDLGGAGRNVDFYVDGVLEGTPATDGADLDFPVDLRFGQVVGFGGFYT
ncbi:hypothetical protein LCGC14_2859840, partial [marine sediment metagenome]